MIFSCIQNLIKIISLPVLVLLFSPALSAATTFTASNWGGITSRSETIPSAFTTPERTGSVSFTPNSYTTSVYVRIQTASVGLPSSTLQGNNELKYGYFEVDFFGITKPIASANFEVFLPLGGLTGGATLDTLAQSVTLRVSDFDPASFVSTYDGESPPDFDTLQIVAEGSVTPSDLGNMLVLDFTLEGLNYLNEQVANGTPSLKFITEINNNPYPVSVYLSNGIITQAGVFENSDGITAENFPRLIVTEVPEPSSSALLGLGFLAIVLRRYRSTTQFPHDSDSTRLGYRGQASSLG